MFQLLENNFEEIFVFFRAYEGSEKGIDSDTHTKSKQFKSKIMTFEKQNMRKKKTKRKS